MECGIYAYLPEALVVNVAQMDDQHAGLFSVLAELKSLSFERQSLPLAELEALLVALRTHFATEARFAVDAGLDFSAHALKHQKMLRGIEHMAEQVRQGEVDIFSLIKYIEYWFERHILDEDRHLAFNLQQSSFATFGEQFS